MQSMAVCSDIGYYRDNTAGYFPHNFSTTGGNFTVDMPSISWPSPVECYPSPFEPIKPIELDIKLVIPITRDPRKDPKTGKFYRKIEVDEEE